MIEALVLSLCIGGYECNTALKALYQSRPALKQSAKLASNQAKEAIGPAYVAIPAIATVITQSTINLRITKNLTAVSNPDTIKLVYGFSF